MLLLPLIFLLFASGFTQRECEEYSKNVIQTVDFLPLLPDPETHSISSAKCDYTKVELIVGGENANQGEFPHMAAIGWVEDNSYVFLCGGSLISSRYVLTAGHCIKVPRRRPEGPSIVRLGDQNLDPNVQDRATPGDSGSPLQVASSENQCIFHIMGITSFGRKCAQSGKPAIYTRVSSYIGWIESVVWPGES
ncbi:unnamed protein product [Leptidea sinapis]|uniref:Peptidase S1 domain-containing protein n=1 Tax=Leptidea sinapis TaxID=189913 RepID=A0A5E4QZ70_9NEOP|nr:unnamed protein product [Leptidea sinapis]